MRQFLLLFFILCTSVAQVWAQNRDRTLNVTVTTTTNENLTGQAVVITQTDYQMTYGTQRLDAQGKCSLKVYSGNHSISVSRDGYQPVTQTFVVSDTEASTDVTVSLVESTRTPYSLTANYVHNPFNGTNDVTLTWNTEAPAFFDDFESYEAFSLNFGEWTGIDGDKLAAAPLVGSYPNRGVMQYAQIFNPLTVEPTWWYEYPILRPYSGKQYVGFTRTNSGGANDDWLISPAIKVGTDNVLTFRARAAGDYAEKFMVYVTTKTDNPQQDDFKRIDTGNYETVDYTAWKKCSYDLSDYAGQTIKFAIRYISSYNNDRSFLMMVDDVYVGQDRDVQASGIQKRARRVAARSAANPNETFDIYQNGTFIGNTDAYTYTVSGLAAGTYTFGVKAKYLATESATTDVNLVIPSTGYSHVTFRVSADSKLSADGQTLNIVNKATSENYSLTVADGQVDFLSLPNGDYVVSIGEGAFDTWQDELTVSRDQTVDITLADNVLDPYNITADITTAADGSTQALVKWNQELLFTDSFESYDDFATGSFGGWTSLDVDQMPVYPISLNGSIITFPGSGTQTNPMPIAPMVFNPLSTKPAMYPTDPAVKAPTGDKSIIFFSPQQSKADKWLISPELTIREGYDLKVTAKSYAQVFPETLEFAVSTEGTRPEDFTVVSMAANMPSDQWTIYSISLADYAGQRVRLGVHYTSTDTFFAQLDDFTVGPENGETGFIDYGNVDHYDIYLDGVKVGESAVPTYTFTSLAGGNHVVGIQAIYKSSKSKMVEYAIVVTGITPVKGLTVPAKAEIYSVDGRRLTSPWSSLPKGVYIVKQGNNIQKISK